MSYLYKEILYRLGAVPVTEVDRKFRADDGEAIYDKGKRIDVYGWLSPYWAMHGNYLTDTQKRQYGIPKKLLDYEEYISLLDAGKYKETKHPLQYTVIKFALENMLRSGIKIRDVDPVIKVYEAGIGLEEEALWLLRGSLHSEEAMQLYLKHRDPRLISVLPVPTPQEEDYINFLHQVADSELDHGWAALRLLYEMNKTQYLEEFRDFLMSRIRMTSSLTDRMKMYQELAEIGDEKAIQALGEALLRDPATEGREAIMTAISTKGLCTRELVSSVVRMAQGMGEKHRPVTISRADNQGQNSMGEYFHWVVNKAGCDGAARIEAENGLRLLNRSVR